uniref:GTPase Era, mitochondrial n=1 Tax=Neogobius melanostomus TaxID=47308 RepID=A0A8C6SCQ6_9GOBI
ADVYLLSPVRCISSEALRSRLMNGKFAESESGSTRLPVSVPPDSGKPSYHPGSCSLFSNDCVDTTVLKVAIIGAPNAGKSTLSNQLLGQKLFAVSKKVHTTRTRAMGVLTEDETQIILLDTPGMTTPLKVKKHLLEKSLLIDPWNSVKEADLVVVLVDVSDRWMCGQLDFEVLRCLAHHPDVPAVLVLNKVDQITVKDRLLDITAVLTCGIVNGHKIKVRPVIKPPWAEKKPENILDVENTEEPEATDQNKTGLKLKELSRQRGWPHFKDVFMLSSLDREDVETLKSYFLVKAKPGEWQYHSEVLTDQTPEQICTDLIRGKLLEYLPQEVPYTVTQSVELWHEGENGVLDINVRLNAKKASHVRMVIGMAGQMVTRMAREVSEDLSRIFLTEVHVKLSVKLKK